MGYTAENSHYLTAKIISKSAVLIGENTSKKAGQMSSKFGEIIKKLIPVFGGKPATGLPKPTCTAPESGNFYTWRKRQMESPSAKSGRPIETLDWGGGEFRVS